MKEKLRKIKKQTEFVKEIIIIDEIGTELEAAAARTIAERGVQLVGTAHGNALENLISLARERKKTPVEGSYTNQLLSDKSLSKDKILEEINELIEAVEKNSNKIHEAADVLYHLIMSLEKSGIKIEEVMEELNSRKK